MVIVIVMLAYHALLNTLLFFQVVPYSPIFKQTGRRVFYPIVLHIILSLYLYIKERIMDVKHYRHITKDTTWQMVSGICIIIFASWHILNYHFGNIADPHQLVYNIIADNLLFISLAVHLSVSIPRLLISFGFLERKNAYNNAKYIIRILIIILLVIIFIAQATFYGGFL